MLLSTLSRKKRKDTIMDWSMKLTSKNSNLKLSLIIVINAIAASVFYFQSPII